MALFRRRIYNAMLAGLLAVALGACQLLTVPTSVSNSNNTPSEGASATENPATIEAKLPTATPAPTPTPTGSVIDITPATSIYSFKMLDADTGWLISDLGVLRTIDGGHTWWNVTTPDLRDGTVSFSAAFLSAEQAFLLPAGQTYDSGQLFRTDNAGGSWTSYDVPFAMGSFQFVDPDHGFFLADLGVGAGSNPVALFYTSDGGRTWQQRFSTLDQSAPDQSSLGTGGIKNGFTFLDNEHGWITGSIPMDDFVYLYASQNGGASWTHQPVSISIGDITSFYSPDPPVFFDASNGLLAIQQVPSDNGPLKKALYLTHDGGATWQALPAVDGSGPLSAPTATDWFFWTQDQLLASHDSGATWQAVTTNLSLNEAPGMLQFVDANHGWEIHFADNAVHFYTTADGGQTWQAIIP